MHAKWLTATLAGAALLGGAALAPNLAHAGSITPEFFEATIGVGETVTVKKTVTTPETGAGLVDVFFLSDNTGSMGGIINTVKSFAGTLLSSLDSSITDVAFGVGRYLGDPREFSAALPPLQRAQNAYTLQQAINPDPVLSQTAINAWFASGGGDFPEANFFALHQVATSGGPTDGIGATDIPGGYATGYDTQWRPGAVKVVVWFGDASSHTTTVDQAEAIAALTDNNVIVAAINTTSANSGIDTAGQATAIVNATDGNLTNNVTGADPGATLAAILDAIGLATATLDLSLFTVGDTSGLDISFTCLSVEGCSDVPGAESREFEMSITGLVPGVYDFETRVVGIPGIFESDKITVTGPAEVAEPATALLLGSGLLGLAWLRRRRTA